MAMMAQNGIQQELLKRAQRPKAGMGMGSVAAGGAGLANSMMGPGAPAGPMGEPMQKPPMMLKAPMEDPAERIAAGGGESMMRGSVGGYEAPGEGGGIEKLLGAMGGRGGVVGRGAPQMGSVQGGGSDVDSILNMLRSRGRGRMF